MNNTIETQAVVVRESSAVGQALGVNEILAQVRLIQDVMAKVMTDGEHYGVIPGTGNRKTLLQPGAQKLTMTFRLAPEYELQETNLQNGHKEYRVICTLKSIQTGNFVGQGVGCCSTMESNYRFRGGARKCPHCGKETIIKGKAEYGGGWLCFGKKGGCGAKWEDGAQEIEGQSVDKVECDNPADFYNCVTPDTKLLTHDLQWVPAGEIESGDVLIGVDEEADSEYARNFAIGEATVLGRKIDDLYEVTFEDGRVVRCNGEHKWLVKKIGLKGTEWVATEDIHKEVVERDGRPRHWTVMSVCKPWTEDTSKEAGYIAGLLDGDGSLGASQLFVMFAQQANIVLALLQRGLAERGYRLAIGACKTQEAVDKSLSRKQVYQVRVLGGFAEQLRLLGSIRPPRLLERWLTLWDLSTRRLEGRGSGAGSPVRIASIKPVGKGEIVILGTSCLTYIAEGLVCHNTVLKMAKKRAFVDATITATAASDIFTQDVGDDEPNGDAPSAPTVANSSPVKPKTVSPPPQTPKSPPVASQRTPKEEKEHMAALEAWLGRCKTTLLAKLQPVIAGANEYAAKSGLILANETLQDASLGKLFPSMNWDRTPDQNGAAVTKDYDALVAAVQSFIDGNELPGAEMPPMPVAEAPVDEWFWDLIIPVPRKGIKRDEYLKAPDTIRSLYDARHGTDEDAQLARERLWGFLNHYQPTGWKKKDGTQMPPSDSDKKFREALDAFGEHLEKAGEKL